MTGFREESYNFYLGGPPKLVNTDAIVKDLNPRRFLTSMSSGTVKIHMEVLIKGFRLAPRITPHAKDLLNQARGLARRSFFRLGTRIARDERWEFSTLADELAPPAPRTPEERVGASIDAQRGLRDCGMPGLAAAIRLARSGGLGEDELRERLGVTPEAVEAALRGGLRPKRYNTCGGAGCRRKVGFHGRRGLCRRCYYATWQKPGRETAESAK